MQGHVTALNRGWRDSGEMKEMDYAGTRVI